MAGIPGANSKSAQASRGRTAPSTKERQRREKQYGNEQDWIRAQPCHWSHTGECLDAFGNRAPVRQASHGRARSRGGDHTCQHPACDFHHRRSDGRAWGWSRERFEREYGCSLEEVDALYRRRFLEYCAARGIEPEAPGARAQVQEAIRTDGHQPGAGETREHAAAELEAWLDATDGEAGFERARGLVELAACELRRG